MNYVWEVALRAAEQDIPWSDIHFVPAKTSSPYMESSFHDINRSELTKEPIEVNLLYRFQSVFEHLANCDHHEDTMLKYAVADILLHYLAQLDLRQGLSRHEFYMQFLQRDITRGAFGTQAKMSFDAFTPEERTWFLSCLVRLYQLGPSLSLLQKVVRGIYPEATIYLHTAKKREVLIYIGKRQTKERYLKIHLICSLFLDMDISIYLYWQRHFPIVGYEETCQMDEMVIF